MPAKRRVRVGPPAKTSGVVLAVKCFVYTLLIAGALSPVAFWFFWRSSTTYGLPPNYRGNNGATQPGGTGSVAIPVSNVNGPALAQNALPVSPGVRGAPVLQDDDLPGLSILILCKDELKSLGASLDTWEKGGVLAAADEVIIYFQGRNQRKEKFVEKWTKSGLITKIIGNRNLYPIGPAISWLVGNASNPLVLFLEKDFQLIEDPKFVVPRLQEGRRMLQAGEADVVRYRSRWQAGEPNFAEGMFKGREHVILQRQPNLYCSVHYWLPDSILDQKPHTKYLWRCPKTPGYYCTKAKFCNWTNNPQMFFRDWFIKRYRDEINRIMNLKPPDNDLEFYMNWNYEAWNNADITVAFGEGLFSHVEIGEHGAINFDAMRAAEKASDDFQDCDLGRRFSKEACENHHCLWQPGHPAGSCVGKNGRLEECGATTQAECLQIERCFWNDWTVWLPASCMRDVEAPIGYQGP